MILFFDKNLANLLRHGKFTESFALPNPLAIISDRFVFVFQVKTKHIFRFVRSADGLWRYRRHSAQIVDLAGNDEGMLQLLLGMGFKLFGDTHIFGALQHLGIYDIRDDGLVFAREVFVQQFRETIAGNGLRTLVEFLDISFSSGLTELRRQFLC